MNPETKKDTKMIGATIGVVGTILVIIMMLISKQVKSQTIGLGLGKVSDGRTSAKLYFITPSGFGAYVCHYADAKIYDQDFTTVGYLSDVNRATMIGITGRIHNQVTVYAGAGSWNICESFNDANCDRYYNKYGGKCAEIGAIMLLYNRGWFSLNLDASINTTRQVNSMILISIKPM